jgi:hypothetical protein
MWQLILLLSILIVSLIFYQNFSTVGIEGLDNRKDDKEEHKAAAKPGAAAAKPDQGGATAKPGAAAAKPDQGAAAANPGAAAAKPAQAGAAAQHGVNRDSKPAESHHGEHKEKKPEPKGNAHATTAVAGTGAAVGTAASGTGAGTSTSNMNKYDSNTIYSPPPSWINKHADTQGSTYASNTATSHSAYAQLPPIQQNAFNQTYAQSICPQSTIENFAASLTVFKNAINTFIQCLERTNNPHYDTLIQKLKGIQTSMNDL